MSRGIGETKSMSVCLNPYKSGIVRLTLHISPLKVEAIFHRCLGVDGLRFKESLLDPKAVQHRDFSRDCFVVSDGCGKPEHRNAGQATGSKNEKCNHVNECLIVDLSSFFYGSWEV